MSGLGHVLGHAVAAARGRRPPFALSYHALGDASAADDPHGLSTPPERFGAQLDAILALGYELVSVEALWAGVAAGRADGLGAVTFDDGLADTAHLVAELCAARGAGATLFLAPGLFGTDHPDLPPGHRILRADEIGGLEAAGLSVGAHSYAHVALPTLAPERQLAELRDSRAALEELVGHPVRTMAYPFGRHDATTVALARQAGYAVACANDGAGRWEALSLPREPVFPGTTPRRLRLKVAGVYGPLRAAGRLRPRGRAA